jgi:hypothetical protein
MAKVNFRARDIFQAISSIRRAGMKPGQLVIENGKITVQMVEAGDLPLVEKGEQNEWDTLLPKPAKDPERCGG